LSTYEALNGCQKPRTTERVSSSRRRLQVHRSSDASHAHKAESRKPPVSHTACRPRKFGRVGGNKAKRPSPLGCNSFFLGGTYSNYLQGDWAGEKPRSP